MDIAANLQKFLDESLDTYCQDDGDDAVLAAVRDIGMSPADRQMKVYLWLRVTYHVLMGFSTEAGMSIAAEALRFADERKSLNLMSKQEVLQAFKELQSRLCRIAPHTRDGQERDVTSLTSKALWLSYPEDVPIYDNQAAHALQVMSRLLGIRPPDAETPYEQFIEVWVEAFGTLMPRGYRSQFCSARRAFDRWLWFLGQPNFKQLDNQPRDNIAL